LGTEGDWAAAKLVLPIQDGFKAGRWFDLVGGC
jgi:hypothetical protein